MPTEAGTGFAWNDTLNRWRDTTTGRFISETRMIDMRNTFLDNVKTQTDNLTADLFGGGLRSNQWATEMRQLIRSTYIDEYAAAHGGVNSLGQADYKIISDMLTKQWQYLYQFQQDVNAGKLSLAQAQLRARMYIESATQAFERARTEAYGIPELPAYPGDGSTVCRANCRCHWKIDDVGNAWECTWTLGIAEHCPDCVTNSEQWAPYMALKPVMVTAQ